MDLAGWRDGIESLAGDALGIVGVVAIAFTLFHAIKHGIKGNFKASSKMVGAGVFIAVVAFAGMGMLKSLAGTTSTTITETQIGDVQIDSNAGWDAIAQ